MVGAESVVGHATSVGRGAVIGERVRIMSKCGISPGTRIEDDVFIASLVVTVDDATSGRRRGEPTEVLLRARLPHRRRRAVILAGVEIGEGRARRGGRAIVSRSVPPGMLVRAASRARVTGPRRRRSSTPGAGGSVSGIAPPHEARRERPAGSSSPERKPSER